MAAEKEIELYLTKQVRNNGGLSYKWVSPGINGVPDRIVMLNGRIAFVETKAPKGRARALQEKVMADISGQGFECRLIDTRAGVDQLIAELNSNGRS